MKYGYFLYFVIVYVILFLGKLRFLKKLNLSLCWIVVMNVLNLVLCYERMFYGCCVNVMVVYLINVCILRIKYINIYIKFLYKIYKF